MTPLDGGVASESLPGLGIWKYQKQARAIYNSLEVQVVVATLIGLNFLTNIVEKQMDPARDNHERVWAYMELGYNIVFTIEIVLNMYSTWFFRFWKSGWNVFDFTVVAIGLLDTVEVPLPGILSKLRMMRAFRVFRLFKKVKSLNKIVVSVVHAIPGMMNAFFINMLFTCIYAVLAVDLFGYSERTIAICEPGHELYDLARTGREECWSQEYFGTFGRSLYTLFQVLSGDSWSEAVVRPIFEFFVGEPLDQFFSGLFFVSFILLNSIVLVNVVVAVLLDKMPKDGQDDEVIQEDTHDTESVPPSDDLVQKPPVPLQNGTALATLRGEVKDLTSDMRRRMQKSRGAVDNLTADIGKCLVAIEELRNGQRARVSM